MCSRTEHVALGEYYGGNDREVAVEQGLEYAFQTQKESGESSKAIARLEKSAGRINNRSTVANQLLFSSVLLTHVLC